MPLRFQKTISLGPLLRINLSKTGVSLSIGPRGCAVTLGPKGASASVGVPGTGVSWRTKLGGRAGKKGSAR